jgi:hypothetical protein
VLLRIIVSLQIRNQGFHLGDFLPLRADDAIGEFPHAWVSDLCLLTRHDGYGMVRDHRFHVGNVVNCSLTAYEPMSRGAFRIRRHSGQELTSSVASIKTLVVNVLLGAGTWA